MNAHDFLLHFENQFDELEPNTINFETEFRSIPEWSSLSALLIIAMIDSEYNVTITGDDIRNSNKIQDLFDIVQKRAQ